MQAANHFRVRREYKNDFEYPYLMATFIERLIARIMQRPRKISGLHPAWKRFNSLLCSTYWCPSMVIKRMNSSMKTMMPWPQCRI